jgi:hypothetical protein
MTGWPDHELLQIGWREWVAFPDLKIRKIKAKIDTGARTSALHAFYIRPYRDKGVPMVRFGIHPRQKRTDIEIECHAEVTDRRQVSDSGGHREKRYVIVSTVELAGLSWPIEMTLTNRDTMRFRVLLGRTAMEGRVVIDPGASFLLGKR